MSSHEAASDTKHPSDPNPTDILDNPKVKNFTERHKQVTEGNRSLLETVDAFITVSAFIAGVQAQLLSVTYNTSSTRLARATNWLGFVGLVLDLASVSGGVLGATLLQQAIRNTDHIAMELTDEIYLACRDVGQLRQQDTNPARQRPDQSMLENRISTIAEVIDCYSRVYSTPGSIMTFVIWVFPSMALTPGGPPTLLSFQSIVASVLSLAGGTLCLLASVILFARASQPHGVWVTCTAIAAAFLAYFSLYGLDAFVARRASYRDINKKMKRIRPSGSHHSLTTRRGPRGIDA